MVINLAGKCTSEFHPEDNWLYGREERKDEHLTMELASEELVAGVAKVKHIVLVLSGKGGVGKSTVSSLLSRCLARKGNKVTLYTLSKLFFAWRV